MDKNESGLHPSLHQVYGIVLKCIAFYSFIHDECFDFNVFDIINFQFSPISFNNFIKKIINEYCRFSSMCIFFKVIDSLKIYIHLIITIYAPSIVLSLDTILSFLYITLKSL